MKTLFASCILAATSLTGFASSDKFARDRAAILAMAGTFEVTFQFKETVALAPGYQLRKPYSSKAYELVKVAEDKGTSITLQHLLVVEDGTGPDVIKHWAQIWKYEDPRILTYEGGNTWLPVSHSPEETEGTWTQFVTQTDDSPRYKARGEWSHVGSSATWTSRVSTRPLPRRDYLKRKDYDLLVVVNHHIITPDGWVHQQDNRKLVSREGKHQFLCVEAGLNSYRRISDDTAREGFEMAEALWEESRAFWEDVRTVWMGVIADSSGSIHYLARLNGQRLMTEVNELAESAGKGEQVSRDRIEQTINKYLR